MVEIARECADIEMRELSGALPDDIALLRRFYTECYEPAFPDPDERESLANMESYLALKEQGWYGTNNYHIVIASTGGEIVGASVCDYLATPNAGVVEYLLVQPGFRRSGLGSQLLRTIEQLCREDALETSARGLDWIIAETEDPYRTPVPTKGFDTFARAHVMNGLGFRILDFDYAQPALSKEQAPADNLLLIARPTDGVSELIRTDVALSIVAEYMRWAMRIDDPAGNSEYRNMARVLGWRSSIRLIEFGEYLGWDTERPLHIAEVADVQDPELAAAISVYDSVYTDPETSWPGEIFRSAVEQKPVFMDAGYVYHLWGIHETAAGLCDGMASFVTMPSAGFGGYTALGPSLRGTGRLRQIIACTEERMIRDNPDVRGWYIECSEEVNCRIFSSVGFFELDLTYEQPLTEGSGAPTPPLRLHLLYKPFGRVYRPPTIERAAFLQAVTEIYWAIYGVNAGSDPSFGRLVDSIKGCETVSAVRVGSVVEISTVDGLATIIVDALWDKERTGGTAFTGTLISPEPTAAGDQQVPLSGCTEQIVRIVRKRESSCEDA